MSAVVVGLPGLLARFARAEAIGVEAANVTRDALANTVAEEMRRTVAVDTGETRDSIAVVDGVVSVGGAALYLEYGTVNMDAEPFVRPAADTADETAAVEAGVATLRTI